MIRGRRDPLAGTELFLRWALRDASGVDPRVALPPGWWEQMLTNNAAIIHEIGLGTGEYLTRRALASLTCPISLLAGDRSDPSFQRAAARVAAAAPTAQLTRVVDSGHAMQVDRPDAIASAVHAGTHASGDPGCAAENQPLAGPKRSGSASRPATRMPVVFGRGGQSRTAGERVCRGRRRGMNNAPILRAIDAVTVRFRTLIRDWPTTAKLGHEVIWRNDDLGQVALRLPESSAELVLTTHHSYEVNWLVNSVPTPWRPWSAVAVGS